jgi:hypothetical protein
MPITALADQCHSRAQEMRTIATGIWDFQERSRLLEFIDDYERLAREVKAKHYGVVMPPRGASSTG